MACPLPGEIYPGEQKDLVTHDSESYKGRKKKNHSLFLLSVLANHYSDRFREIQTTQSQHVAINLANNFTV
jgi:hypothetical protein